MSEQKLSDISLRDLTVRHVKAGYPSVYHYVIALEAKLSKMERLEEIEQACIKLYVGEITKTEWRHVVRNGPLAKKLVALAAEEEA